MYEFKDYAKVTLSFQDAKDIELINPNYPIYFWESADREEGTAFCDIFYSS